MRSALVARLLFAAGRTARRGISTTSGEATTLLVVQPRVRTAPTGEDLEEVRLTQTRRAANRFTPLVCAFVALCETTSCVFHIRLEPTGKYDALLAN